MITGMRHFLPIQYVKALPRLLLSLRRGDTAECFREEQQKGAERTGHTLKNSDVEMRT